MLLCKKKILNNQFILGRPYNAARNDVRYLPICRHKKKQYFLDFFVNKHPRVFHVLL